MDITNNNIWDTILLMGVIYFIYWLINLMIMSTVKGIVTAIFNNSLVFNLITFLEYYVYAGLFALSLHRYPLNKGVTGYLFVFSLIVIFTTLLYAISVKRSELFSYSYLNHEIDPLNCKLLGFLKYQEIFVVIIPIIYILMIKYPDLADFFPITAMYSLAETISINGLFGWSFTKWIISILGVIYLSRVFYDTFHLIRDKYILSIFLPENYSYDNLIYKRLLQTNENSSRNLLLKQYFRN